MELFDVLIVGGGPIGLACALEARKNNLKYIMLTAGVILALIGMTVLVSVFLIKRRKRRKLNEK